MVRPRLFPLCRVAFCALCLFAGAFSGRAAIIVNVSGPLSIDQDTNQGLALESGSSVATSSNSAGYFFVVDCDLAPNCSGNVRVTLLARYAYYVGLTLSGQSTDPNATGTLTEDGGGSGAWTVNGDGSLAYIPFASGWVTSDSTGYVTFALDLQIDRLADGATLTISPETLIVSDTPVVFSSATPEPASVLSLLGGLAALVSTRRLRARTAAR